MHYLKLSLVDFTSLERIRLRKDVAVCIVAQLCLFICCSAADDQANQVNTRECTLPVWYRQYNPEPSCSISKKLIIDTIDSMVCINQGIYDA